jgi:hypothetical protein
VIDASSLSCAPGPSWSRLGEKIPHQLLQNCLLSACPNLSFRIVLIFITTFQLLEAILRSCSVRRQ